MLVVAGMLAFLCVIAVLHPFLRRDSPDDGGKTDSDAAAGYAELESMLDSIQTLQLERQLGNIPEDSYREQLHAYRLEAASLLQRIDESRTPDPEQDLERQVLLTRLASNGVSQGTDSIRRSPAGKAVWGDVLSGTGPVCTGCGEPSPGQDEACPVCGQSQSTTATRQSGVSEE